MEVVRWEPFTGLNRIQSRINDLFDETLRSLASLCEFKQRDLVSSCGRA